ncbi:MAG: T9SS type A sorting domain-containing protein [Bacteroidaceae bacterium]|nr:T9SS type A sorting domain-containing protein [Bacteroidaceae bacterium]
MKKTIILTVMLMGVVTANAQLKVDTLGHVGINVAPKSNAQCYIRSTQITPLNILFNNNQSTSIIEAATIEARKYNGYESYGIHGIAKKNNYGMACGILGEGLFTSTAYPFENVFGYGVIGRVGTLKGAGIYGTISATDHGCLNNGLFAGYFNGPVHIVGNLTATGTINGVVLSPNASSSGVTNGFDCSDKSVLSMLDNLDVTTFMIENRAETAIDENDNGQNAMNGDVSIQIQGTDSLQFIISESQINPSLSEKQIYSRQHYGLSAEAVEHVFPELVYENEDGSKSINYMEMVPILVQAINELKAEIRTLKGESSAKVKAQTTEIDNVSEDVTLLSLGQNKPNPFSNSTTIEVSIPHNVKKTFIYVYDLQGKKVDQIDLAAGGKQQVKITSAKLSDGIYLYSLVTDGRVVETRRMIVEK